MVCIIGNWAWNTQFGEYVYIFITYLKTLDSFNFEVEPSVTLKLVLCVSARVHVALNEAKWAQRAQS